VKNFASVFGGKIDSIQWFIFWGKQNGNGESVRRLTLWRPEVKALAAIVGTLPERCWCCRNAAGRTLEQRYNGGARTTIAEKKLRPRERESERERERARERERQREEPYGDAGAGRKKGSGI